MDLMYRDFLTSSCWFPPSRIKWSAASTRRNATWFSPLTLCMTTTAPGLGTEIFPQCSQLRAAAELVPSIPTARKHQLTNAEHQGTSSAVAQRDVVA